VIEAHQLTKCDGDTTAVEDLSVTVRPGIVTGFLGPNGAGRPTTMRIILGLDAPTSGSVTVNGCVYVDHPAPLHPVGALLDANVVHTGRSADHLRVMAATTGIGRGRVEGVIEPRRPAGGSTDRHGDPSSVSPRLSTMVRLAQPEGSGAVVLRASTLSGAYEAPLPDEAIEDCKCFSAI
jgi:energy-coupling factor transporter ATP-binding protein EcfA2